LLCIALHYTIFTTTQLQTTATEGGANAELEVKDLKDTMGEGKHLDLEDNDPANRNTVSFCCL
jgi:hypothetical protein